MTTPQRTLDKRLGSVDEILTRVGGGSTAAPAKRTRTVVLANGVFDVFHVGHLRYLEGAAKEGDILVVAVNSDASTRAYKGPDRPLIPEDERAEIVAGLACVDWVLVFDDADVTRILRTLRPDVHAKGTDYTPTSVPERAVVLEYGGRIAITGDPKAHSSTQILARLTKPEP